MFYRLLESILMTLTSRDLDLKRSRDLFVQKNVFIILDVLCTPDELGGGEFFHYKGSELRYYSGKNFFTTTLPFCPKYSFRHSGRFIHPWGIWGKFIFPYLDLLSDNFVTRTFFQVFSYRRILWHTRAFFHKNSLFVMFWTSNFFARFVVYRR